MKSSRFSVIMVPFRRSFPLDWSRVTASGKPRPLYHFRLPQARLGPNPALAVLSTSARMVCWSTPTGSSGIQRVFTVQHVQTDATPVPRVEEWTSRQRVRVVVAVPSGFTCTRHLKGS
ncbi:hypothetical protein Bbelb_111840 [Branchiostoma belcheri]|nr:hypothetical protein Bbelb_111810 [Branchiostoma belcheri]KAI8512084.1 hypothetical protein Bbelb_111840 [Branchiostoma belcheri]